MASRKSSASYAKGGNFDGAASCDALVLQGDRSMQPRRQPEVPPPVERQKDEGFARFLKKHSSPTHNRVTAGGRIVPMEPRSPPAFSLSTSDANSAQSRRTYEQIQEPVGKNGNMSQSWVPESQQMYPTNSAAAFDTDEHVMQFGANAEMYAPDGFARNGPQTARQPFLEQSVQQYQVSPAGVPTRAPLPMQPTATQAFQHPIHPQQVAQSPYQSNSTANLGLGVPLIDHYGTAPLWPIHPQGYGMNHQMPDMMSTQQMLASWEQHYNELDQQLKNIDRHRAIHNRLDPSIVDQRKVIVQQRSDAKDTVKEYQAMLGIRRQLDSSGDSWNASFNVDAPCYHPMSSIYNDQNPAQGAAFGNRPGVPAFEKPKAHGQRRIIPIIAPKDRNTKEQVESQPLNKTTPKKDLTDIDNWTAQPRHTPVSLGGDARNSSDNLGQWETSQAISYDTSSQQSASSSVKVLQSSASTSTTVHVRKDVNSQVSPVGEEVDQRTVDRRLLDAIMKPLGVVTQVYCGDGTVLNVGGQALEYAMAGVQSQQLRRLHRDHQHLARACVTSGQCVQGIESAAASIQPAVTNYFPGKENICVMPQGGHRKAATDAFLAQFNAVEDKMSVITRQETQSLHAPSASRNASHEYPTAEQISGRQTMLASREDIMKTVNHGAAGGVKSTRPEVRIAEDYQSAQAELSTSPESLMNKGYSLTGVQNVHAVGSLPHNFDGAVEARQSVQAQLAAASKCRSPRSPRFLRRLGMGTGA